MTIKTDNTQVIENLKCCMNCKRFSRDVLEFYCKYNVSGEYCKHWQYDGLTREDRE